MACASLKRPLSSARMTPADAAVTSELLPPQMPPPRAHAAEWLGDVAPIVFVASVAHDAASVNMVPMYPVRQMAHGCASLPSVVVEAINFSSMSPIHEWPTQ